MSAPYTTGQACQSTVVTANTAGQQLCLTPANNPTGASPSCSGWLHSVTFSADTTANTLSFFDGTSTGGTLRAKIVTPTATVPVTLTFDIQFFVGMFISLSGATTANITIVWE
ncbi:MAG: hypothetical protein HRJ53_28560 [Acidobacteria bacterium Pan2503]|uniref:Uncharacterized protein n=1 Tax=Candidatus Acidiferrum panamense TaxID=2741543 RepID=A0A7V8NXG5_9BACT|nr:hypothetical protein [Candidatus Acidoferrum panamensis]